ncbi:MAG: GNAT family N-acetyltransferase [Desulfobacterales bacterium]|nr:GNAT family N-acetyltransferase [Desulfobacterales bacterium]
MNPPSAATAVHAVTITSAGRHQAAPLAALIRQSYADVARRFGLGPQNAPTHPSTCTTEWIAKDCRAGVHFYLASRGTMIVGCAALKTATSEVCYLMRLAVLPLFRRQGIGSRLVQHVCRAASRTGASELSVGLIAAQADLIAWYRRQGFRAVARRRFAHLPFEVLFMRLELGAAG